jgi:hypothetical protein
MGCWRCCLVDKGKKAIRVELVGQRMALILQLSATERSVALFYCSSPVPMLHIRRDAAILDTILAYISKGRPDKSKRESCV